MIIRPVGEFGTWQDLEPAVSRLKRLARSEPDEYETEIISYLESSEMILPWMEYTTDVIGGRFGSAGGSATVSDGVWFWRYDTAEYVRHYHISLPPEFREHCIAQQFVPKALSETERQEIEIYLLQRGGGAATN